MANLMKFLIDVKEHQFFISGKMQQTFYSSRIIE